MHALRHVRFSSKLPAIVAGFSMLFTILFGVIIYSTNRGTLLEAQKQKLIALNSSKADHLHFYLTSLREDLELIANDPSTSEAIASFAQGWVALGETARDQLQNRFIHGMESGLQTAVYDTAHDAHHRWFEEIIEQKHLHDVFLFDLSGNLIYSARKEIDFGHNAEGSLLLNTSLAAVYRAALHDDEHHFRDFAPYTANRGSGASFMSRRVTSSDGKPLGVLVIQVPTERFSAVMQVTAGLGLTGEAYIVGEDGFMRSNSRFSHEKAILNERLPEDIIAQVLENGAGVQKMTDYRGVSVLSAYSIEEILGTRFVVLTDAGLNEIFLPIYDMRRTVVIATVVAALVMSLVGFAMARMVTQPLSKITDALIMLAEGNTDVKIPMASRRDEFGQLAGVAKEFLHTVKSNQTLSAKLMQHKQNLESLVVARTSELQAANAELEEFAYRTSHDLRSPLVSSIALLGSIQEDIADGDFDDVEESVSLTLGSLKKLETLVHDILALTQARHMDEPQVDVDLEEVVENALEKFCHMENYDRVDIRVDLKGAPPPLAKSRLVLIVENLISNAIKYQDTTKTQSFLNIFSKAVPDGYEITVEDNGIGFPKEQRTKMFSMFKRFHPDVSFGSGLGLYMVHKSAQILGGELRFTDTEQGTRFELFVPTVQGA